LANERTFLAWIRTTLALLAGAAAVHALDLSVSDAVQRYASALLAAAAFLCAIQAWFGWSRTEAALRNGRPLPGNATGVVIVVVIAGVSLLLVVVGARG
jgi:putative membrane protein